MLVTAFTHCENWLNRITTVYNSSKQRKTRILYDPYDTAAPTASYTVEIYSYNIVFFNTGFIWIVTYCVVISIFGIEIVISNIFSFFDTQIFALKNKMRIANEKNHIILRGQRSSSTLVNLSKKWRWPKKVIFSGIVVCFAMFGCWVFVAIHNAKAKYFEENLKNFTDFNFTRYIMNEDNITDAQYKEISKGLDHWKNKKWETEVIITVKTNVLVTS